MNYPFLSHRSDSKTDNSQTMSNRETTIDSLFSLVLLYLVESFHLTMGCSAHNRCQLQPDIRRAISSWIAHLVSTRGTTGLFAEIHVEVFVHLQATVLRVAVDLQQV